MKVLSLDIGDVWTGSALSDDAQIVASPYQTVATKDLESFLADRIAQQKISTIVIGYPKTMRGTESEQTKKVIDMKVALEERFPETEWVMWDERLTSKHAQRFQKSHAAKDDKLKIHSLAAALILAGYLESKDYGK